jgi:hypothetical protein
MGPKCVWVSSIFFEKKGLIGPWADKGKKKKKKKEEAVQKCCLQ